MIARTWRGATDARNAQNYVGYLRSTGFAGFAATPGNLGAIGLRRIRDGKAEFVLLSLWDSEQAVQRFAGPAAHRAVFYPEDARFLVERDEHVDHFEVVYTDLRPRPSRLARLARWWMSQWESVAIEMPRSGWRLAAFR